MKDKLKLPPSIKIAIFLFVVFFLFSITKSIVNSSAEFYNSCVSYKLELNQKSESQITTAENNFLSFKDQFGIADISKEAFITVTDIIMSSRKDGMNIAWKWMHENQQIPYSEFTSFYKDLSQFTKERFTENNAIEKEKQELVKKHNMLITTFPGVVYNMFFKIKPLVYKKGFISRGV